MPPPLGRPRIHAVVDDSRSDISIPVSGGRHSHGYGHSHEPVHKSSGSSEKRKNTTANTARTSAGGAGGPHVQPAIEGIQWDNLPTSFLHQYRSAYNLRTPSASSTYNHAVLSTAIGKKSPSYHQRQSQEALIAAIRRNFNNQAINEHDVIVDFLYAVKNKDRQFRRRFTPNTGPVGR